MKIIVHIFIILGISWYCFAANPISSFTSNGTILSASSDDAYGEITYDRLCFNASLLYDNNTYWVHYMAQDTSEVCISDPFVASFWASTPSASFPGSVSRIDFMTPFPGDGYLPFTTQNYVVRDPIDGYWYEYNAIRIACPGGNWIIAGLRDNSIIFDPAKMQWFDFDLITPAMVQTQFAWTGGYDTFVMAPRAGGGWILWGTCNGGGPPAVWGGVGYATADTLEGPWTMGEVLMPTTGLAEYFVYFVYNGKYYWLVNQLWWYYQELYSSDSQYGPWTDEGELDTGSVLYLTALAGYSLDTGSMYGLYNYEGQPDATSVCAFTMTATPISVTSPGLTGVSSNLSSGTLTVTGTATKGTEALWEVGLYNQTTGARSRTTWSSWGESSPGSVNNTFSGTISASASDVVIVTVYDVTLDSYAENVDPSYPTIYGTVSSGSVSR